MNIPLLGETDPQIFDQDSGYFLSAKAKRIAEVLEDFDPSLRLMWIPPNERTTSSTRPYAIGQVRDGHEPYAFMYLNEDELDHRLIGKLFRMRAMAEGRPGSLADEIERAEKVLEYKKELERRDEADIARDKATFLWRTPKHTVKMDGKVWRL